MSTTPIQSSSSYTYVGGLPDETPGDAVDEGPGHAGADGDEGPGIGSGRHGGNGPNGAIGDFRDTAQPSPGLLRGSPTVSPPNNAAPAGGTPGQAPQTGQPPTAGSPGTPAGTGSATPPGPGQRAEVGPQPSAQTPGTPNGTRPEGANGPRPDQTGALNQGSGLQPSPSTGGPGSSNGLGNAMGNVFSGLGHALPSNLSTAHILLGGMSAAGSALSSATPALAQAPATGLPSVVSTVIAVPNAAAIAAQTAPVHASAATPMGTGHATTSAPGSTVPGGTTPGRLPHSVTSAPTQASPGGSSALPAPAPLATSAVSAPRVGVAAGTEAGTLPQSIGAARPATSDPTLAAHGNRTASANDVQQGVPAGTNAAAAVARASAAGSLAINPLQAGALTLAFAPFARASNDDQAVHQSALFRAQGADGQEVIRDILGKSYVFTAEGKLTTRAQERAGVDPIAAASTEVIDELSASNHGELSTHELVWKVAVPAFVGVGALLGGATLGAASAAGTTGMSSSFLLVAAAGILGYGATRAIAALADVSRSGDSLNPLENRATAREWVAAGSQSVGSLGALALLLI